VGLFQSISRTFGKLLIVAALLVAFLAGMLAVVWMSLRGDVVTVPQIIGKDVLESEKELASLGLKLKKRANRFSKENPNTILEQLPKPGEMVKTGQTISVVVSKMDPEDTTEEPATVDEDVVTNTANPNAPKREKKVEKKASTTRDVESTKAKTTKTGNATVKANSSTGGTNSNSSKPENKDSDSKPVNKNGSSTNTTTKVTPPVANKPAKPPTGGDSRPRKIP
jgi:PASTA domain